MILFVIAIGLVIFSFLDIKSAPKPEITGGLVGYAPIVDINCPQNYPVLDANLVKVEWGNYNLLWRLIYNELPWDVQILWSDINITNASRVLVQNSSNFTALTMPITGSIPLFRYIKLITSIKHGNLSGTCKPVCIGHSTLPEAPGTWVDPCYNPYQIIRVWNESCPVNYTNGSGTGPYIANAWKDSRNHEDVCDYFRISPPYCCYGGTVNEGWYTINCSAATICTDVGACAPYLIEPAQCESGEFSVFYEMFATDNVIFEQKFRTAEGGTGQNTSINWFVNLPFNEGTLSESGDLLDQVRIDYVSKLDPSDQKYYGTSRGTRGGNTVVVGSFAMEEGKPYFASAAGLRTNSSNLVLSFSDEAPALVTFDLSDGDNLVSLPLNTTLNTTEDLCDSMNLANYQDSVTIWNPQTQDTLSYLCGSGEDNQNVLPGEAYTVDPNVSISGPQWTQE